jgi:hypothetical protein
MTRVDGGGGTTPHKHAGNGKLPIPPADTQMTGETLGRTFEHVLTPGYKVRTEMSRESYLPIDPDHVKGGIEFGASREGFAISGLVGAAAAAGVVTGIAALMRKSTPTLTGGGGGRGLLVAANIAAATGAALIGAYSWNKYQKHVDKQRLDGYLKTADIPVASPRFAEEAAPTGVEDALKVYRRKPNEHRVNNDYRWDALDLLPDVRPRAAKEVVVENYGGRRLLRFSSTWFNIGEGALQVGFNSSTYGDVAQIINRADGTRKSVKSAAQPTTEAGNHYHTHLEDMSEMTLYKANADGTAGARVSRHHKVSFLLTETDGDIAPLFDPEGRQRRRAESAPNRTVQGFGVGRGDTYGAGLEGQEFDITALPPGTYILRMNFDPNNRIAEEVESNNMLDTRFTLTPTGTVTDIKSIGNPRLPRPDGVTGSRSDEPGGYDWGG